MTKWAQLRIAWWAGLYLAFTWIVDPYGVSPVRVSWQGINAYKPHRLNIDRLIKPYEVWRYQPRTVFLGTSRIHQSIDPAVLDGTKFAPAYNASVPASLITQNAAFVEDILWLAPSVRHVVVEMFIYNFFTGGQSQKPVRSLLDYGNIVTSLHLSSDTLWASVQTLAGQAAPDAAITQSGQWKFIAPVDTAARFNAQLNIDTIIAIHKHIPDMILQPTARESLDRMVAACRRRGVELHLFITPSYPWDDYRLQSLGYWPRVEEWLRPLSTYPNVISFSQYNAFTTEAAGPGTQRRYHPIHFSERVGALMQRALLLADSGLPSDVPENFSREL